MYRVSIVCMLPSTVRKMGVVNVIPLAGLVLKNYAESKLKEEHPESKIELSLLYYNLGDASVEGILQEILSSKPDLVCFSTYIWNYREAIECIDQLSYIAPQIPITCGGPMVAPIAKDIMEDNSNISIIPYINVPGEDIFYNLVYAMSENLPLETVEGIIYRDQEGLIHKTDFPSKEFDYNNAPSPYINGLLPQYIKPDSENSVVLEASRGCTWGCSYCLYSSMGTRVKWFPEERILQEIDIVYTTPHVSHVVFSDSDILRGRSRAKKIIEKVLQYNDTNIITEFEIQAMNINEENIKLLSQLNDFRLCIAIQTINPDALALIGNKRPTPELFKEKFELIKKWSPSTEIHIDLMLGLPGDTLKGYKESLDFVLLLNPTRIGMNHPVWLLPGTTFFEKKDELELSYGDQLPIAISATKTFPKKDIEYCAKLSIWVEIISYYYPAISSVFQALCHTRNVTPTSILEEWLEKTNNISPIFPADFDVTAASTGGSLTMWNSFKGKILESASSTDSALAIYSVVCSDIEELPESTEKELATSGLDIMNYLKDNNLDAIEFDQYDIIPDSLKNEHSISDLKMIFSKFYRA